MRDRIAYISFERREKHNAFRDEDLEALTAAVRRLDSDDTADIGHPLRPGSAPSPAGATSTTACSVPSTRARQPTGRPSAPGVPRVCALEAGHRRRPRLLPGPRTGHRAALRPPRCLPRTRGFQVTETRIGLPMPGLIPQLGTPAFAYDVAMTGRMFTAEEAMAGGALTRLAEDGEQCRSAEDLARQILENPQTAVRALVQVRRAMIVDDAARYNARRRRRSTGLPAARPGRPSPIGPDPETSDGAGPGWAPAMAGAVRRLSTGSGSRHRRHRRSRPDRQARRASRRRVRCWRRRRWSAGGSP